MAPAARRLLFSMDGFSTDLAPPPAAPMWSSSTWTASMKHLTPGDGCLLEGSSRAVTPISKSTPEPISEVPRGCQDRGSAIMIAVCSRVRACWARSRQPLLPMLMTAKLCGSRSSMVAAMVAPWRMSPGELAPGRVGDKQSGGQRAGAREV